MHPASTRNEFLRLRVQGLSLAAIGRRLAVSKPTVIKWNRQCQSEIASRVAADHQRVHQEVTVSAANEIAALTRRLTALKQELFSRALRDIPTATLETLVGELNHRLESLQGTPATSSLGTPATPTFGSTPAPTCPEISASQLSTPQLSTTSEPIRT